MIEELEADQIRPHQITSDQASDAATHAGSLSAQMEGVIVAARHEGRC